MGDVGYSGYDDPRLQPPEIPDPAPAERFEWCIHGCACAETAKAFGAKFRRGDNEGAASVLMCADCTLWEE